jgi:very-short-patch-repair endonuclease
VPRRARRKSALGEDFVVAQRVEEALAELVAEQHVVFRLEQLVAQGLSRRAVYQRAERSRLHRVHQAVYSLVPPQNLSRDGRYMAAVLAGGDGAALSHRSAAELLNLRRRGKAPIEVTVPTPGGRLRRRDGLLIHRSTTLRRTDITRVRGIPCTTIPRTVFDLADVIDRRGMERVLDEGTHLEVLDVIALNEQIGHNAGRKKPAKLLKAVLKEHHAGETRTWNEFEELLLRLCREAGLPDPEVDKWLDLGDGEPMIQPDFLWRAERVIVESDGWDTHGTRAAFESDRRRDQRAMVAGWRVVRVTWRQARYEPQRIAQTIVAVVASAAPASESAEAA